MEKYWAHPPADFNAAAYAHPLHYWIAAAMKHLGANENVVAGFSALCGSVRLILVFKGLRRYLPESRLARGIALASIAFFPPGVHIDAMMYSEPLNNLLATIALLLAPGVFAEAIRERWRAALWLGLVLGLELLTKVSALTLLAAFGLAALAELALRKDGAWRGRFRRAAPWVAVVGIVAATTGWYFADNYKNYGRLTLTSFEASQKSLMDGHRRIPYLARRRLSFVFGWSTSIYKKPYFPAAQKTPVGARFFPVILASAFVDYYSFSFCPPPSRGRSVIANRRRVPRAAVTLGIAAVVGGTGVALATVLAWLFALRSLWRRRDYGRLALLLAPLMTLVGALHFAIKYPVDSMGVIKSSYLQYGSVPLYALFGLAVWWLWSRRWGRPLAILCLLCVAPVFVYTFYCRVGVPLSNLLSGP